MKIEFDFRLLDVSLELSTLEKNLELIEGQIESSRQAAKHTLEAKRGELPPDDEAEWDLLRQEYDYEVDFVLPRVLHNPFLVSLFAVYESAVKEIAKLIQKKQGARISLEDLKGDLLNRAKKYYDQVLQFDLSKSNDHWQRLMLLSDLRNAIAHTNGRLDLIKAGTKQKILKSDGVREYFDRVLVEPTFLRETFTMVKDDLESLVARYKAWDTANRT